MSTYSTLTSSDLSIPKANRRAYLEQNLELLGNDSNPVSDGEWRETLGGLTESWATENPGFTISSDGSTGIESLGGAMSWGSARLMWQLPAYADSGSCTVRDEQDDVYLNVPNGDGTFTRHQAQIVFPSIGDPDLSGMRVANENHEAARDVAETAKAALIDEARERAGDRSDATKQMATEGETRMPAARRRADTATVSQGRQPAGAPAGAGGEFAAVFKSESTGALPVSHDGGTK